MKQDTTQWTLGATTNLTKIFWSILISEESINIESFENSVLEAGHRIMANAMALALETFDAELCKQLDDDCNIHDRRSRQLATKMGDISFTYRRIRDKFGCSIIPLADELDLPWCTRISPAAKSFLVQAGAEMSYKKAADLLEPAKGSLVSANAVMQAMRQAGSLCAEEDYVAAHNLYVEGVIPDSDIKRDQISLEVDGTWVSLQGKDAKKSKRVEIKALFAYGEKQVKGGKVVRSDTIRHACVESPELFWTQGISTLATRFDLSELTCVHVGQDGERWCGRAEEFFPTKAAITSHLDSFPINRYILCAIPDKKLAQRILGVLWDGGKIQAISFLEACKGMGLANKNTIDQTITYLKNNIDLIDIKGPSLGTMESENQHVYGARMDAVPCAWSIVGASDMARIRSRYYSNRDLPYMTREKSLSQKRRSRREKRVLNELRKEVTPAGSVLKYDGRGCLPPHQASLANMNAEIRYVAGVDSAMIKA